MKKTILLLLFGSASLLSFSQTNTVASGNDATGSGGSASYTVGQIDYINNSGSNGNVHQGVQQPFEFFKAEAGINENNLLDVSLYPNPTNESVTIEIPTLLNDLTYHLYDMTGKLITTGDITDNKTLMNMSNYSSGEYHFTILSASQPIESIKIIKH